jgi:hypothetical protein
MRRDYTDDSDLKYTKKGRTISDPAFLQFNRLCVSLVLKLSLDSQPDQPMAEEKQGRRFGDTDRSFNNALQVSNCY